jgi:hypothetical protein
MSTTLKVICLVNAIVWIIIGVLLLVVPGRFLTWLDWTPIEPVMSRMLGAAFLALAWGDLRVWRGSSPVGAGLLVEMQIIFSTLAALGLLRHLLSASFPVKVWILFAILVLFALAWLAALLTRPRQSVTA